MIYLDNNSTTQLDSRVLEEMIPYYLEKYGNPSSNHLFGKDINFDIEKSRNQIGSLINCSATEIFFTSGATESINTALKGYALSNINKGNHIITLKTEHKAVLKTCEYLQDIGFNVTFLNVFEDGLIDLDELRKAVNKNTILVSIMIVNNETGVIQPIKEISGIVKESGAVLFSDATQAVGKIPIDVQDLGIDMMGFSPHKFHGPKGIGGLYIKDYSSRKLNIQPLHHGGNQENNLRSGTLNVPSIIGFGKICEIALMEMEESINKIKILRDSLELNILKLEKTFLNGSENRIHNVSNICFKDRDLNLLLSKLKEVIISNGSACNSSVQEPSHVLMAMGLSEIDAFNSIRFSIGKYNSIDEIIKLSEYLFN